MGKIKKKKRKKLFSVYATIEGEKREVNFLRHLKKIYLDETKVKLTVSPIHGGNPDRLLNDTFKRLFFGYKNLPKINLENKRKNIRELDLLISMITVAT